MSDDHGHKPETPFSIEGAAVLTRGRNVIATVAYGGHAAFQAAHAVACVNALAGVDVERFAARLAELRDEAGKPCSCDESDDESDDSPCPTCEAVGWLEYLGLEAR